MINSENFEGVFQETLRREGGYKLHNVEGDTGGLTYAGIARNKNPGWPGWAAIDRGETPPTNLVREFYYNGYWVPLKCDLLPLAMARELYDFAVNTSAPGRPTLAAKLFQLTVGATPDGVIGHKTIEAARQFPPEHFPAWFTLAKIKRYAEIVNRDRSQLKFLRGWINRSLEGLK